MRERIANTLAEMECDAFCQDIGGIEPGEIRPMLRRWIDGCDGVLHLPSYGYGFAPDEPDPEFGACSYTQFEFLYARSIDKPTWLILPGPNCTRDTPIQQLDLSDQGTAFLRQAQYLARWKASEHLWAEVDSDFELEIAIRRLKVPLQDIQTKTQAQLDGVSTGQKRQSRTLATVLTLLLIVLLFGGGAFAYLKWQGDQTGVAIAEKQEITRAKIKVHLEEARQRALSHDLAEAEAQPGWQERERLKTAARAAHTERLSRIDALANDFAQLEGSAEATSEFDELTRILTEEGVEQALLWLESQRGGILQIAQHQQEAARKTLQPLLKGALLAQSEGEEARAERLYRDVLATDPAWPEAQYQFCKFLLYTKGPRRETHATLADAAAVYEEAERLARRLVEDAEIGERSSSSVPDTPDSDILPKYQRELSAAHEKLGNIAVGRGDLNEAARRYGDSLAIRQKLASADPGNSEWQRDLSISHNKLGDIAVARGDLEEAARQYGDLLAISEKLAAADPGNSEWLRDLSVSHDRLGDIAVARGDLEEAARQYGDSLAIRQKLAAADPGNSGWQRDLSVSHDRLGDIAVARGDLEEAARQYGDSLAIRQKLASADPGNSGWQRDLSISHNKLGDIAVARGDLEEAARQYRDSLAIRQKLATTDPGNSEWQRDLSVSHNKMGGIAVKRGDLEEAARQYGDSLAIRQKLAAADPGNSGWQRDLSVSHNKLGDITVARGDLEEAARQFGEGLAIAEKLASADPGNSVWQRDLSISHDNLGNIAKARGDLEEAARQYGDSLAIRQKLASADPGNSGWQRDLSVSHNNLGDIAVARGDLEEVARQYGDLLAISVKLASTDPGNSGWQRDLSVSYDKLGDIAVKRGDLEEAARQFGDSLAISEKLASADPGNSEWQRDSWVSHWNLAKLNEKMERKEEARNHLAKVMELLWGMKEAGTLVPVDEKWIAEAERQMAALEE